jgi:ornithine carbamoyltransferase
MRHFLTLKDYTKEEILEIINISIEIKKNLKNKVFKNITIYYTFSQN